MAAYRGVLGAVEMLLCAGADAASTNHMQKMTPLHAAVIGGHREVCVLLLEAGAPTDKRDNRGRTAAAWARRRAHPELAELITTFSARRAGSFDGGAGRGEDDAGEGAGGGRSRVISEALLHVAQSHAVSHSADGQPRDVSAIV